MSGKTTSCALALLSKENETNPIPKIETIWAHFSGEINVARIDDVQINPPWPYI
jgi:hypothetical protein